MTLRDKVVPGSSKFSLVASKSALIIIDIQKFVSEPQTEEEAQQHLFSTALPLAIENMGKLTEAFRSVRDRPADKRSCSTTTGCEVIFVYLQAATIDGRDVSLDYKVSGPKLASIPLRTATMEDLFLPELRPDPMSGRGDILIQKTSYSVFVSTNLDHLLRNLGIEQVVLAGQLTDQCIESAVRDAADLGYVVTLAEDACAATSEENHQKGVLGASDFARIVTTDQIVEEISSSLEPPPVLNESAGNMDQNRAIDQFDRRAHSSEGDLTDGQVVAYLEARGLDNAVYELEQHLSCNKTVAASIADKGHEGTGLATVIEDFSSESSRTHEKMHKDAQEHEENPNPQQVATRLDYMAEEDDEEDEISLGSQTTEDRDEPMANTLPQVGKDAGLPRNNAGQRAIADLRDTEDDEDKEEEEVLADMKDTGDDDDKEEENKKDDGGSGETEEEERETVLLPGAVEGDDDEEIETRLPIDSVVAEDKQEYMADEPGKEEPQKQFPIDSDKLLTEEKDFAQESDIHGKDEEGEDESPDSERNTIEASARPPPPTFDDDTFDMEEDADHTGVKDENVEKAETQSLGEAIEIQDDTNAVEAEVDGVGDDDQNENRNDIEKMDIEETAKMLPSEEPDYHEEIAETAATRSSSDSHETQENFLVREEESGNEEESAETDKVQEDAHGVENRGEEDEVHVAVDPPQVQEASGIEDEEEVLFNSGDVVKETDMTETKKYSMIGSGPEEDTEEAVMKLSSDADRALADDNMEDEAAERDAQFLAVSSDRELPLGAEQVEEEEAQVEAADEVFGKETLVDKDMQGQKAPVYSEDMEFVEDSDDADDDGDDSANPENENEEIDDEDSPDGVKKETQLWSTTKVTREPDGESQLQSRESEVFAEMEEPTVVNRERVEAQSVEHEVGEGFGERTNHSDKPRWADFTVEKDEEVDVPSFVAFAGDGETAFGTAEPEKEASNHDSKKFDHVALQENPSGFSSDFGLWNTEKAENDLQTDETQKLTGKALEKEHNLMSWKAELRVTEEEEIDFDEDPFAEPMGTTASPAFGTSNWSQLPEDGQAQQQIVAPEMDDGTFPLDNPSSQIDTDETKATGFASWSPPLGDGAKQLENDGKEEVGRGPLNGNEPIVGSLNGLNGESSEAGLPDKAETLSTTAKSTVPANVIKANKTEAKPVEKKRGALFGLFALNRSKTKVDENTGTYNEQKNGNVSAQSERGSDSKQAPGPPQPEQRKGRGLFGRGKPEDAKTQDDESREMTNENSVSRVDGDYFGRDGAVLHDDEDKGVEKVRDKASEKRNTAFQEIPFHSEERRKTPKRPERDTETRDPYVEGKKKTTKRYTTDAADPVRPPSLGRVKMEGSDGTVQKEKSKKSSKKVKSDEKGKKLPLLKTEDLKNNSSHVPNSPRRTKTKKYVEDEEALKPVDNENVDDFLDLAQKRSKTKKSQKTMNESADLERRSKPKKSSAHEKHHESVDFEKKKKSKKRSDHEPHEPVDFEKRQSSPKRKSTRGSKTEGSADPADYHKAKKDENKAKRSDTPKKKKESKKKSEGVPKPKTVEAV